jgi:hypothetical protein
VLGWAVVQSNTWTTPVPSSGAPTRMRKWFDTPMLAPNPTLAAPGFT